MSEENYGTWMERVAGGRGARPLEDGDVVTAAAGEPFGAIEFLTINRATFKVEVGKKLGDYIYHFFPSRMDKMLIEDFEDKLGDAFLEVFKFPERIEAAYDPEMSAWAVRATGFANNTGADQLALQVIDVLAQKLE